MVKLAKLEGLIQDVETKQVGLGGALAGHRWACLSADGEGVGRCALAWLSADLQLPSVCRDGGLAAAAVGVHACASRQRHDQSHDSRAGACPTGYTAEHELHRQPRDDHSARIQLVARPCRGAAAAARGAAAGAGGPAAGGRQRQPPGGVLSHAHARGGAAEQATSEWQALWQRRAAAQGMSLGGSTLVTSRAVRACGCVVLLLACCQALGCVLCGAWRGGSVPLAFLLC